MHRSPCLSVHKSPCPHQALIFFSFLFFSFLSCTRQIFPESGPYPPAAGNTAWTAGSCKAHLHECGSCVSSTSTFLIPRYEWAERSPSQSPSAKRERERSRTQHAASPLRRGYSQPARSTASPWYPC